MFECVVLDNCWLWTLLLDLVVVVYCKCSRFCEFSGFGFVCGVGWVALGVLFGFYFGFTV